MLHKKGWRGINIDLSPDSISAFNQARPDDLNIVAAVGSEAGKGTVLLFPARLTNRLVSKDTDTESLIGEKSIGKYEVQVTTLDELLEKSEFRKTPIDYLNIDCEGADLDVLRGISLSEYRPRIITIEAFDESDKSKVKDYLLSQGYELKEQLYKTLLFVRGHSRDPDKLSPKAIIQATE